MSDRAARILGRVWEFYQGAFRSGVTFGSRTPVENLTAMPKEWRAEGEFVHNFVSFLVQEIEDAAAPQPYGAGPEGGSGDLAGEGPPSATAARDQG